MKQQAPKKGFSAVQVAGIVLLVFFLTLGGTLYLGKRYLFPAPFTPVHLSQQEQQVLQTKLYSLGLPASENSRESENVPPPSTPDQKTSSEKTLSPEPYREDPDKRTVQFTERELNAMLANNTDLADKVAIDLAENLLSINMLIPLDPGFPILGGKTLRINAGAELAYRDQRPVIILRGVSLMGVPMPKTWLGGLKNVDLIEEFGSQEGFWKSFSEGVDSLIVKEGQLEVMLKE